LKFGVEPFKIKLSNQPQVAFSYSAFLGGKDLKYNLSRAHFNDLIEDDVRSGLARLDQALRSSGVTPKVLARLFLSGGTCNIPAVRDRLSAEVAGNRMVDRLQLPDRLKSPGSSGGLDDIGNATAMGAALLAVHAAEPVFASSIGIRLADASGDQFYAVFKAGDTVSFKPKVERLFISDASSGVARLLICDQDDPVRQPGGRLLRIVPVPIHRQENWLDVTFTLDRHLVLRVEASGRKEVFRGEPIWVQHLNLGFRIPDSLSTDHNGQADAAPAAANTADSKQVYTFCRLPDAVFAKLVKDNGISESNKWAQATALVLKGVQLPAEQDETPATEKKRTRP
jgi:molecular chaperone DnaK (HSP70)